MNFDDCIKDSINSSLKQMLEQMKSLQAEDRYNLLCEWGEFLFCEYETEEVLMVPNFQKEVQE